ncbi:hypothetical protein CHELA40_13730 [Chelatococcus asaccharovorans]|nr:hypothetical protein CHELA40_13730 [Chelatococcus asaccharovorans]CAH1676024.1 hypothetical protein CHELA17_61895 [Chelatococcus asaccharovorans]
MRGNAGAGIKSSKSVGDDVHAMVIEERLSPHAQGERTDENEGSASPLRHVSRDHG